MQDRRPDDNEGLLVVNARSRTNRSVTVTEEPVLQQLETTGNDVSKRATVAEDSDLQQVKTTESACLND